MIENGQAVDLVRFSLRLRMDLLEEVTWEANRLNASINDVLNHAVAKYVENDGTCRCCGKPL